MLRNFRLLISPKSALQSTNYRKALKALGRDNMTPSEIYLLTDKQWSVIDGEVCRATNFSNALPDIGRFTAYGSIDMECKKLPNKMKGIICHKTDFTNLYKAFNNTLIKNESDKQPAEVIISWSKKRYKNFLFSFFSFFLPRMIVLICPKEAYEFITDPEYKKEIQGEARFLKERSIIEYKPDVMK